MSQIERFFFIFTGIFVSSLCSRQKRLSPFCFFLVFLSIDVQNQLSATVALLQTLTTYNMLLGHCMRAMCGCARTVHATGGAYQVQQSCSPHTHAPRRTKQPPLHASRTFRCHPKAKNCQYVPVVFSYRSIHQDLYESKLQLYTKLYKVSK